MISIVGKIFDIQRFSVHDGPGIRTTIFMKGCPLRCTWCHNPEGLSFQTQLKFNKSECINCKLCGDRTLEDVDKCPTGALSVCGKEVAEDELLKEILKDRIYYSDNGGVTFSGGECLMQADFVASMLKLCKENNLNTTIDTSGYVNYESIKKTLPYCDLYLYDIKSISSDIHKTFTGVDNELILNNLKRLSTETGNIWVRIPVIPSVNNNEEEMSAIARFISELPADNLVATLIPYHSLGLSKYDTLSMKPPYETDKKITTDEIDRYREIMNKYDIITN